MWGENFGFLFTKKHSLFENLYFLSLCRVCEVDQFLKLKMLLQVADDFILICGVQYKYRCNYFCIVVKDKTGIPEK